MKTSDFFNKKWLIHPVFHDTIMIEGVDDFSFQAGDKALAEKVVEDHNKMLELENNQEVINLTFDALNRIEILKAELYSQVDSADIFRAFITLELPKFLNKTNSDNDPFS